MSICSDQLHGLYPKHREYFPPVFHVNHTKPRSLSLFDRLPKSLSFTYVTLLTLPLPVLYTCLAILAIVILLLAIYIVYRYIKWVPQTRPGYRRIAKANSDLSEANNSTSERSFILGESNQRRPSKYRIRSSGTTNTAVSSSSERQAP